MVLSINKFFTAPTGNLVMYKLFARGGEGVVETFQVLMKLCYQLTIKSSFNQQGNLFLTFEVYMASPLPVGHYLRKTNTLRKLTSDQNPLHLRTIYQLITHNKLFFSFLVALIV